MGIQIIKGGSISAYLKLAGDVALSSSLVSVVDQTNAVSGLQLATASIGLTMPTFLALPNWTNTLGTKDGFSSQQTVAVASAGTGVFRMIRNNYTINNAGAQTGSVTGIFLNATETALNGITHNLIDLQVGGGGRFTLTNAGVGTFASTIFSTNGNIIASNGNVQSGSGGDLAVTNRARINSPSDGILTLRNWAATDFTRLNFGGTTSSFPSIKRNGAAIDFRLADDSGFCGINPLFVNVSNVGYYDFGAGNIRLSAVSNYSSIFSNWDGITLQTSWGVTAGTVGSENRMFIGASGDASAKLAVTSTTKGFLMPRMTQAQILAIVAPAAGLMVFNTDLQKPCFYDAAVPRWERCSSSVM